MQVGGNHLLQAGEVMLQGGRSIPADAAGAALDRHQAGHCVRDFDAGKVFLAFFVTDHNCQVEAQVRDMREWVTWIKCQGGNDLVNHFVKVFINVLALLIVERPIFQDMDARFA